MNQIIREQHQRAQGFVQCFVVDAATGKVVKEYPRQRNLILNQGMDQVATNYWADLFVYCSAGTGTTPTSDDSSPTTATQAGTTVTLSGGSFVFTNTLTDAGKVIKWDTGEEATIVTVTDPSTVVVNNSAVVPAADFIVYRTNQTGLSNQVKRTNTYLTGSSYCGTTLASNVFKMRRTYDFTAEVGTVNYTEIGLGWHVSTPTAIFSRILLAVPVPVNAGQQLRVTYELQLTLAPSSPVSKTAIIGGWPVAPASTTDGVESIQYLGVQQVNTSGNTQNYDGGITAGEPATTASVGVFVSDTSTAPASFGSAISRAGTGAVSATRAAYVVGQYYVDKSGTLPVGTGNSVALRSMGHGYHSPNLYFAYQSTTIVFVFNEAQTKLNTHTLTLTWRLSWSRVLS
jgi:hypothetical protein